MTARPHQLRHDPALRTAISTALDAVLAQHPERAAEARRARHLAAFEEVWAGLGYPNDPALKRRTFAQVLPRLEAGQARHDLAASLAAHDRERERQRRFEAASRLGRAQGQARAGREHFAASADASRALVVALDHRITHRRSLTPVGPIRLW